MHCRTVNDEGVAGLTQETLQEPGRQKNNNKQSRQIGQIIYKLQRGKTQGENTGNESKTTRGNICFVHLFFQTHGSAPLYHSATIKAIAVSLNSYMRALHCGCTYVHITHTHQLE